MWYTKKKIKDEDIKQAILDACFDGIVDSEELTIIDAELYTNNTIQVTTNNGVFEIIITKIIKY